MCVHIVAGPRFVGGVVILKTNIFHKKIYERVYICAWGKGQGSWVVWSIILETFVYGVATISRPLKIIRLFCRI